MDGLLTYLIKCTLYVTIFQTFYMIVMKKTTFFRLNRIIFMSGTLVCMMMPLMRIILPASVSSMGIIAAGHMLYSDIEAIAETIISGRDGTQWGRTALRIIYFGGVAASVSMTALSMIRMVSFILSIPYTQEDGAKIRVVDKDIASFSWGRNIVIGRSDVENNPLILKHEKMHIRCGHSFDLMAYSVVTAAQWFNPIVWYSRKELKMLHEYEADALTAGEDNVKVSYQLLLLRKAVGENQFEAANGFNQSRLKGRISMMNRKRSYERMKLLYLLCIPILAGAICCCSDLQTEALPANLIEEAPKFQGGDANSFSRWVNRNLIYPQGAKDDNAMGRVTITFTINETGKVTDVRVLSGVHPDIDKEAIRVVSSSPDWTPGRRDGRPVPVSYTFPIIFHLR